MKISNLYCSEMVLEEKRRKKDTHTLTNLPYERKLMAKLCTPSNKRKCRMTHSAGTVFLFLIFSVWCLIFFLCFTAVSESDGPEIRSTCYSHIMNMFAQWIVITASQSKCTRMDYMLMHINSSSLLYFCVCVSLLIPFGNAFNTNLIWNCRLMLN